MTEETATKIEEVTGIKPEKITEDELSNLQSTVRTIDRLTADIGRMETQKYAMLVAMQKVQKNIEDVRTQLFSKYGTDNINIANGEIAYAPETPKTEENGEADKED